MEPAQPSILGEPTQGRSLYGPPPNSPELAQQTLSSSPIPESSTTHQDTRIFSPIPTRPRPRPSQVAEAGHFFSRMLIAIDAIPRDHLAQVHQSINRGLSTPITTEERLQHYSRIRDIERQRQRLYHEEPRAAERLRDHRHQRRHEIEARRHRHRRHHASNTDALADSMRTLSTYEPEHDSREENIQRTRRQQRELQDRQIRRARDHSSAARAQQMNDVEQSVHGGADEMDLAEEEEGEEEEGSESMATDMQYTSSCAGPTEDSDVQMFNPRFPHLPPSEEN